MQVENQDEVIALLSQPATYGACVTAVERVETHISIVFLAGPRAYKLKRAVVFPYLDFSTRERRHHFCLREVAINRRTAPELYLGVVPVTRQPAGDLALGGSGEPVDWLVVMERFDDDALFDRLAARGALTRRDVEALTEAVARFHAAAEVRPGGGAAAVAACIENNTRAFAEVAPSRLDPSRVGRVLEGQRQALAALAARLDRRQAEGFVRQCHGDLHLRNVVRFRGRPLLFDAIEFNDSFAHIDVLYDVAFLVMDLEFRGLSLLASIALNRYLDATGDVMDLGVLPLFLSMRASIRSHVTAAAATGRTQAAEVLTAEARRYLDLASAYLEPPAPRLIAIGGLSGSGKSRLARTLAPELGRPLGARVIRTDTTRKRLAGVPFDARLDPAAYTPSESRRTYAAVLAEAEACLAAGLPAIVDGVFARAEERRAVREVAARASVPFLGLWLEAPAEALTARVEGRQDRVSDATAEVVRQQLRYDLGTIDWRRISSSGSPEATAAAARAALGLPQR